jgi:hypothetical protein
LVHKHLFVTLPIICGGIFKPKPLHSHGHTISHAMFISTPKPLLKWLKKPQIQN